MDFQNLSQSLFSCCKSFPWTFSCKKENLIQTFTSATEYARCDITFKIKFLGSTSKTQPHSLTDTLWHMIQFTLTWSSWCWRAHPTRRESWGRVAATVLGRERWSSWGQEYTRCHGSTSSRPPWAKRTWSCRVLMIQQAGRIHFHSPLLHDAVHWRLRRQRWRNGRRVGLMLELGNSRMYFLLRDLLLCVFAFGYGFLLFLELMQVKVLGLLNNNFLCFSTPMKNAGILDL